LEKMYFDRGNNYKDMGKYEPALVVKCLTIANNYDTTSTNKSNNNNNNNNNKDFY